MKEFFEWLFKKGNAKEKLKNIFMFLYYIITIIFDFIFVFSSLPILKIGGIIIFCCHGFIIGLFMGSEI